VLVVDLCADGSVRLTAPSLEGERPLEHDAIPYLEGA
jgi:hypothetical protein